MHSKVAELLAVAALAIAPVLNAADVPAKDEPVESSLVTKLKTEFAKDKALSATNITVENETDGIVTLGGRAATKEQADQAIKLARDTSGVISVKSNIVIAEETRRGNGKPPADGARR